ncbi:hypothetical protein H5410_008829 [Solanum commersonii]|uniref:Uncharacterized protein n=1 Tax=Solanum commersonii TaxID=4109 RepID=A0A9J6AGY2_SOLCO|nr:hypothetical protein H5410_008829 [Solanum commersonii]
MMSPKPLPENRGSSHSATMRQTPLQIIHVVGNFMRIWSVYSMYRYLSQTGASVVLFIFCCLLPSCIWFLVAQKPWKGRALANTQVVPSVVNGGITALYFILWGKGLKSCGPVRAILGEYSGAVLGVLSGVLLVDSLQCLHPSTFYHKDGRYGYIFSISYPFYIELFAVANSFCISTLFFNFLLYFSLAESYVETNLTNKYHLAMSPPLMKHILNS